MKSVIIRIQGIMLALPFVPSPANAQPSVRTAMGTVKHTEGKALSTLVCTYLDFILAAIVARFTKHISGARLNVVCIGLCCCLAVSGRATAQAVGGSISGTVKDVQGGVLPNVTAVFTNTKTGVATTVQTNQSGLYRGSNLQPGIYDLKVTISDFSTGVKNNITLNVGADLTVDFELKIAGIDQNVTVTGAEASVDLATSALSYDVPGTTIRELPLNGRDFTSLATLQPGVSVINGASGGSARTGLGRALTISGQRPAANNFIQDGISLNDEGNNTPGSILGVTLGVDAVEQFTLLTDTFAAEYGNAAGGVVNAVTRSGADQYHGSAFYFGRNSAIDALNRFDVTRLPNPEYRRHQYGGSAGGPIKKDKAFWFADYEAIGLLSGSTTSNTVPTPSFWAEADPNVQRVQKLFPQLTTTATCVPSAGIGCTGTYNVVLNNIGNEKYTLGKVNYKFSEKDSVSGSYFIDRATSSTPDAFKNQLQSTLTHRQGVALEYTRTVSSSKVNIARFGFTRSLYQGPKVTQVYNPAINDTSLGYVPGKTIGGISVSGITSLPATLSAIDYSFAAYNSFQGYENFILTKGTHAFKFGGNVNRMQYNSSQPNLSGGSYTFGTLSGFQQNGNVNAYNAKTPSITFAAQLAPYTWSTAVGGNGQVYSGSDERGMRLTLMGAFAQDDWRIKSNLTINYGVRYEITNKPSVVHGLAALVEHLTDPQPRVGGPIDDINPTLKNVSPRVGLSYDPFKNGKTAIRAGFGIFDSLMLLNEYDTPLFRSFPFFAQAVLTVPTGTKACTAPNVPAGCTYLYGSFPNGGYSLGANSPAALRTAYDDPAPPRSYILQWNLNIEQQVGSWMLSAGYVGARGVHLLQVERNIDTVTPTKTSAGWFYPAVKASDPAIKINPNYSAINTSATWNSDSDYSALHVSAKRSMSKGLQVVGSYAFGKSIDSASSTGSTAAGSGYPNAIGNPYPLYPVINRGLSDFDIRHNASISLVWDVPNYHSGFKPLETISNGWELAGIYKIQTGAPFSVVLSADENYVDPANPTVSYRGQTETDTTAAGLGQRPNVVAGCKLTNPGNINNYINSACFSFPSQTQSVGGVPGTLLGNLRRNALTAPGYQNADLSLIKNDKIGERFTTQFRFEFFNALNHPNLAAPGFAAYNSSGQLITSTFGIIKSTGGNAARQIQYGFKLTF
jgi:Carboxypeptidase regulatory-like domain/TonB-dependent Receptor Plug Domain